MTLKTFGEFLRVGRVERVIVILGGGDGVVSEMDSDVAQIVSCSFGEGRKGVARNVGREWGNAQIVCYPFEVFVDDGCARRDFLGPFYLRGVFQSTEVGEDEGVLELVVMGYVLNGIHGRVEDEVLVFGDLSDEVGNDEFIHPFGADFVESLLELGGVDGPLLQPPWSGV